MYSGNIHSVLKYQKYLKESFVLMPIVGITCFRTLKCSFYTVAVFLKQQQQSCFISFLFLSCLQPPFE